MPTTDKTTAAEKPIPTPPVKGPSLSDTQARDNFIAVALGQIVAWQMAKSKLNHDQAGTYAVRYANAAMAARAAETAPLKLAALKGIVAAPVEVPRPEHPPIDDGEKPKTIAEIIGDAEPLEEVK